MTGLRRPLPTPHSHVLPSLASSQAPFGFMTSVHFFGAQHHHNSLGAGPLRALALGSLRIRRALHATVSIESHDR